MFVLIAGGGRTATQLAHTLLEQNHKVRVVYDRREALTRLHRELPTEVVYEGSPTNPLVLEQAGIGNAQVVAACSDSDADNLVVCYLARHNYHVNRTIARINDPRNSWLFDEKFHVDVSLDNAEIMSRLIEEEMSLGDMVTVLKLRRGDYSLVEEKIPAGAQAEGVALRDLHLPDNCLIVAIIRHGQLVLPLGHTVLEAGDEILAVTDRPGAEKLVALFAAKSPSFQ